MKKLFSSLMLASSLLSCGKVCNINHQMTTGIEHFLRETSFYEYVITNIDEIKYFETLDYGDRLNTAKSTYYPETGCCIASVALKANITQDEYVDSKTKEYPKAKVKRENIDIAGSLVHEAAHCESKSSDEEYPDKKQDEYYHKAVFVEDIEKDEMDVD